MKLKLGIPTWITFIILILSSTIMLFLCGKSISDSNMICFSKVEQIVFIVCVILMVYGILFCMYKIISFAIKLQNSLEEIKTIVRYSHENNVEMMNNNRELYFKVYRTEGEE